MATQDVFIRQSSGLTRQISARDALMYSAMNPGLLYALVYLVWAPAFYPGAHMGIGVLFVLLIFPIAGLYWYFSVSMPRSGGEYIYISRTLHPSLGLFSCFVISITALSWTGQIQDWWIRWGLADSIRSVGISQESQGWIDLANFIDRPLVRFVIGTGALLLTGWLFLKGAKAMMRISYWAVGFAWLAVLILGLLLGVTGQDGAYLAELLLTKGYEVHGIKRRASLFNTQRIDHLYEDRHTDEARMILHYGDMTDSTNLIRLVQETQPDEIYNLAAQSHVQVSFETAEYTANADALGTLRLLEAIRLLGLSEKTRFYQASTSELYGQDRFRHHTPSTLVQRPSVGGGQC
jgi:hypothetical protein